MERSRTQESVFLAVGIPRTTYQQIEGGNSDPLISDLVLIASTLEMPLADLIGSVSRLPQ